MRTQMRISNHRKGMIDKNRKSAPRAIHVLIFIMMIEDVGGKNYELNIFLKCHAN